MTLYSVVIAFHIIAVIAAYGLPISAPLLVPYVRGHHPEAMAGLHAAQHRLNVYLTGPATVLVLLFGMYLASKGHYWSKPWVSIGLLAIVIIALVGGLVIVPATKRLAQLAKEDFGGAEYEKVYRRYLSHETMLVVVVLVTIFFMAAKPFN